MAIFIKFIIDFDDNQKLDAFEIVQLWKFTVIFNVFDVQQNCLVSNLNFKKNIDYVEEIVVLKPNERHILRQVVFISFEVDFYNFCRFWKQIRNFQ